MKAEDSNYLSTQHNIKHFINSWQNTDTSKEPYEHFLIKNNLDDRLIDDLCDLPFEAEAHHYNLGTREEFNPSRHYITPDIMAAHPCANTVAEVFRSKEVLSYIESRTGAVLKDTLLRIEYAIDSNHFWLKPHTDIGAKNFTMLLYMTVGTESETWGTDIYYNAEHHHSAVPYSKNSSLIFVPSAHSWHGFEPREIKGIRKSLIINYVKQEWRNRHELTHPTQVVY